jgi:hypothetical protein
MKSLFCCTASSLVFLQLLESSCSASQLDAVLLRQTLSAAAVAAAHHSGPAGRPQLQQQLRQLEEQLQQLSHDALQPLLDALLLPGAGSTNSTTAGTTPGSTTGTTAATTGSTSSHDSTVLLEGLAVVYVLRAAVLPRLQQLSSAAPKSLLLSLVTVGKIYGCHVIIGLL